MNPLKAFIVTLFPNQKYPTKMYINSIYEIKINALNGKPINLSEYKGKYILFVNVASKCGFTSQYNELQELHTTYKNRLQVIGVPCNQFGDQEPGDADDITSFCEVNYRISFLMTEKINVKGKNQHPLYAWLTKKTNNGHLNTSVKWNFQKYLVDTNGHLVNYFLSVTSPLSTKIIKHLK
jgi:glutathione peroxidase